MPNHNTHDILFYPILILIIGAAAPAEIALPFAVGMVFGGIWLSPDLDTRSAAWNRWGAFKWLWVPYQMCIPHRSGLSHWPIFGTVGRLVYMATIIGPIAIVAIALWDIDPYPARAFIMRYDYELCTLVIGIEASAIIHAIADLKKGRTR